MRPLRALIVAVAMASPAPAQSTSEQSPQASRARQLQALSARGFQISTANKMLVLIDGRTVYSPVFAGTMVNVAAGSRATAQAPAAEANVKAVFLFNFTKYVTWPAQGIGERSPAGIRVCVTANDTFFTVLKSAVQDEDIDGKPLEAIALDGLDDAPTCQILYVGNANSPDGKAWLNAVRGRQVLTVADGPLNDETVIAFIRDENRVRFDINRAAAARHGLNISSKLLRLARHVRER